MDGYAPKLPFVSFLRPQPYNPDTEPLLRSQDDEDSTGQGVALPHILPPSNPPTQAPPQFPPYPVLFAYPGTQQPQIYGYPYPIIQQAGQVPFSLPPNAQIPTKLPQGLPYYTPYPLPAPQFVQPEAQPPNKSLRRAAIACLVTYIVGFFTFFPHLASIILSLRIAKKGYLVGFKNGFLIFSSILELIAWTLCACFWWFYKTSCYEYSDGTMYATTEIACSEKYYGWIPVVVWFSVSLVFGLYRVALSWHGAQPAKSPQH